MYKTYAFKYCQYALVSKYIYLQYGISLEPQTSISIGQISITTLLSNEYLKLAYPKLYLNLLPKVVLSPVYSISYDSDYNIANSCGDLGIIFDSFFFILCFQQFCKLQHFIINIQNLTTSQQLH